MMKYRLLSFFMFILCFCTAEVYPDNLSLIPLPMQMKQGSGLFKFEEKIYVNVEKYMNDSLCVVLEKFAADFKKATGITVEKTKRKNVDMKIKIDTELASEAYRLCVTDKEILIEMSKPVGLFYALQTLKQLMPRNVMASVSDTAIKGWSIPVVDIVDEPRFSWRGFMLDVGRHFYDKEEIKTILDIMAAYKMNRFHWHLTEDQGWRIEIKKYPRLTEIGAWRDSKVLAWGDVKPDGIRYGGYYTQDEAKEIVAYARERFIEVIPEVDIPGHSQAAIAAYPGILACDVQNRHEVWLWQGVSDDVMNVASYNAVRFAKDVIDELIEIFPFTYIHLGGDECPTIKWEKNDECRNLLNVIGSENYRDLQINFYMQLKEYIALKSKDKQRRLIFWNEVLHGNTEPLGKDITIMSWVNADRAAHDAANKGMDVILSPQIPYYINRRQSALSTEPRSQGVGTETVEAVYNYVPMKNVADSLHCRYIGVQANFWTEWVEDASILQYLMLPRLAAVAEAAWTPQYLRDFDDFKERLKKESFYYRFKGVNYGKHVIP